MEAQSEYVHNAYMLLHIWCRFVYAQSVITNKVSASEPSGKFVKSIIVGWDRSKNRIYSSNSVHYVVEFKKS